MTHAWTDYSEHDLRDALDRREHGDEPDPPDERRDPVDERWEQHERLRYQADLAYKRMRENPGLS